MSCLQVAERWLEVGTVVAQRRILVFEGLEVCAHLSDLFIDATCVEDARWHLKDVQSQSHLWDMLSLTVCKLGAL